MINGNSIAHLRVAICGEPHPLVETIMRTLTRISPGPNEKEPKTIIELGWPPDAPQL